MSQSPQTPPKPRRAWPLHLIPGWRRAWRFASVQVAALAVVWLAVPRETQEYILALLPIDEGHLPGLAGALFIVARVIAQPKLHQ
jgi:hypothetical protein